MSDKVRESIFVAEARQCKALSRIADDICARPDVRIVLLCGGSAAGKTTTAKRLVTQLKVNERAAIHLSTDDYFVGDERNPRDENGDLDYEHVECVDIPRLVSDLNALMHGDSVPVRRFDFATHTPVIESEYMTLPSNGIIVLEGIHALNPRLTEGIVEAAKYRVYINLDPEWRFLRRMVRDNHFRKMPPTRTIELWPKVLAGEAKWILPFCDRADVVFDSHLDYEIGALKPYVGGLLERSRKVMGDLPQIMRYIELLRNVEIVPSDLVPGDSILRETIGGSQLEY